MPEVTIIYKKSKTLQMLKDLAKYFDFVVSAPKSEEKKTSVNQEKFLINGVTMIRGAKSINTIDHSEMNEIMTRSNMDAKELRSRWQRKK